jgi:predicted RNA binding protein YcfA (HicA-like mRNA interferase family)
LRLPEKFPVDVPIRRVLKALELLGFVVVRAGNHIAMQRENADGTRTPLTLPNHSEIKGSTLRAICTQSGVTREAFLAAYEEVNHGRALGIDSSQNSSFVAWANTRFAPT